jgi:hypothetical protein
VPICTLGTSLSPIWDEGQCCRLPHPVFCYSSESIILCLSHVLEMWHLS